ncbi:hypothetical protein FHS29_002273 [Saccharothrix tamanrassetensis]|uniref:Uncharacterized protein n=1 Tax=Saccharothrix tamanrassetensis TaxID=1051531 RepID=A0A841CB01_9PSEU|nr:hypothetical protein [Saccharothrix tamanrassetensis]
MHPGLATGASHPSLTVWSHPPELDPPTCLPPLISTFAVSRAPNASRPPIGCPRPQDPLEEANQAEKPRIGALSAVEFRCRERRGGASASTASVEGARTRGQLCPPNARPGTPCPWPLDALDAPPFITRRPCDAAPVRPAVRWNCPRAEVRVLNPPRLPLDASRLGRPHRYAGYEARPAGVPPECSPRLAPARASPQHRRAAPPPRRRCATHGRCATRHRSSPGHRRAPPPPAVRSNSL